MAQQTDGRRPRQQFSEEFKEGAVRLVLDEDQTVGAVARDLDLTLSALALWVRQAQAERTKGKSGLMREEREELARVRKKTVGSTCCCMPRLRAGAGITAVPAFTMTSSSGASV